MKGKSIAEKRRPGRPLSFDRDAALHQAMLLFWRHGFEAASVNDLTAAMAITPPSLYTAFGDKKQLFLEAVQRYISGPVTSESIIDNAITAREAATDLLRSAAIGFTGEATPSGCLLASSTISCSPAAADVQKVLSEIRSAVERRLRGKIERDNRKCNAKQKVDAGTMAGYVMTLIQGMSTMARDGATRTKLLTVVDTALKAWPE